MRSSLVTYTTLFGKSRTIRAPWEAARLERKRLQRERHVRDVRDVRDVHDYADDYWRRATAAAERGSGPGYDEATNLLIELREVARHFDESAPFEGRFQTWVAPHLRRPALVTRLRAQRFPIPTE